MCANQPGRLGKPNSPLNLMTRCVALSSTNPEFVITGAESATSPLRSLIHGGGLRLNDMLKITLQHLKWYKV